MDHTSGDKPKQDLFLLGRHSKNITETHKPESLPNNLGPDTCPLTPKTKLRLKKINSEEDFVKFQVPWIM